MSNYKDLKLDKFKDTTDIVDSGTEGTKIAVGTTGQRGSTTGQIRFNSTTGLAEYYDGTSFRQLDTPPVITSIDDGDIDSAGGGNQTIVITGSNFSTNPTVLLVANSGSDITPSTVTRNSSTQITIVHAKSGFVNANEPYDVKVTNTSGLSAILADSITVDNAPVWQTSAGALTGSPFTDNGTAVSVTLSATDADSDTVTYAVQSGALPSGITLNSSTGVISGNTPNESSDVTYNFTIRATANSKTTDRAFSMQIIDNAPPTWTTSAGSIGSVYDSVRGTATITVVASDADGDTITYSVQSGSLPAGSSLNTSTGVISGFDAVGSDTTSTFTLRASATGGTVDREFSITVKAPVSTTYSYTGSEQSWTIPTGLTAFVVDIKGASANKTGNAGNGGSGGRTQGTRLATAGQVYKIIVGQGGSSGGAYGGGGSGGGSNGGGGGGLSGIFLTSYTHGNSVAIAGGGGGGAWGGCGGGDGGGTTGGQGGNSGGGGGTQSAGGSGANSGGAGSTLTGGNCNGGNGGAGGGGYYGGGGGGQGGTDRGGGGGSGYTGGLESGSSMSSGGGSSGNGVNGEIIITY